MRSALTVLLLVAITACGDHSLAGPSGFTRAPCRPPADLVAMVTGRPFAPTAMRSALLYAAAPMSSALGTTTDVHGLQDAIRIVVTDIDASDYDGACRLLTIAGGFLSGLPATPSTLPDRDGIRLILALTAQSLADVMPK